MQLTDQIIDCGYEDLLLRAREGLLAFTAFTFPGYEINWHHRALCKALNRFASGEIKRLIICLPPRHGKSQLVSRQLPAFLLGRNPNEQIIAASYSAELASAMNRDVQRIIDSEPYRILFPNTKLYGTGVKSTDGTTFIRNSTSFEIVDERGSYRSAGVGGSLTGHGGTKLIIDDPIKNKEEADSEVYRNRVWDWWTSTLRTRAEKDAGILVTVTRWHEDDLVGRLLTHAKEDPNADQWEVIILPAICEVEDAPYEIRKLGGPLWPNKYSLDELNKIRTSVGSRVWSALYQQRPAPESGNIVKREWWRFYTVMPESFDIVIQAWDATFTGGKNSDFVAGVVLGKKNADIYLLDLVHDRLTFTQSLDALKNLSRKWPDAIAKYVEKAANGEAIIDTLKKDIPGLIGVTAIGSKIARANAVSPRIESGNVYLPHPSIASWVSEVIEEWASFPTGAHDDIVDAMSHGIMKLAEKKPQDWAPMSITRVNPWK